MPLKIDRYRHQVLASANSLSKLAARILHLASGENENENRSKNSSSSGKPASMHRLVQDQYHYQIQDLSVVRINGSANHREFMMWRDGAVIRGCNQSRSNRDHRRFRDRRTISVGSSIDRWQKNNSDV